MSVWSGVCNENGSNKWYMVADHPVLPDRVVTLFGPVKPRAMGMQEHLYPASSFPGKVREKEKKGYVHISPLELISLLGGWDSLPEAIKTVLENSRPLASRVAQQAQQQASSPTVPPAPSSPPQPAPAQAQPDPQQEADPVLSPTTPWQFKGAGLTW